MSQLSAAEVIARLQLAPHPEGGHYREMFRDTRQGIEGRAASTAIYFLLGRGERSHWHRVDAVEVWHFYAGSPLELQVSDEHGHRTLHLGADLMRGQAPQAIVAAGAWQAAESLGDWTLVGLHGGAGLRLRRLRTGAAGMEPRERNVSCAGRKRHRRIDYARLD